ncbi:RAMP superfamily CRISPR-associated protein [Thioalkalivibrio paradoxus]|uniref:RAMP superfamily CRISPR-associated protein n=1 Tax=Thioalkalivibrio paradoxus TaxID=108010 RepID=UPI00022C2696|nr:RAMP superfamily CRISPR-associated protein [Thioalkalivibrio paradoxus]
MIALIRTVLREPFQNARNAHPGLLLQRGYPEHESGATATKTEYVERICRIPAGELYRRAYERWQRCTADPQRFAGAILRLDSRLFIGLSAGGMLETGCAIHHSYGVPYIPGSSIKGVVSGFARAQSGFSPAACNELFGAAAQAGSPNPDGLSGVIGFHDAWWVPDSATTPLVQEVVTSHHLEYYGSEGGSDATDLDSPVPNAQVAVRGSFLFVIEGPGAAWLDLARDMLQAALQEHGIGAKTRAGYGYFSEDTERAASYQRMLQDLRESEAREREEAEARAAFDALSDEGKALYRTEEKLTGHLALSEAERRMQRSVLVAALNQLTDAAKSWPPADRRRAAELLERAYDAIGWFDPGKDKKKREKQEAKRRAAIQDLRG